MFSRYELKIDGTVYSDTSVSLNDSEVTEVTINGLDPNTHYEISLAAVSGDQAEEQSDPATTSSYTGKYRFNSLLRYQ